jgi:hypothetical protein
VADAIVGLYDRPLDVIDLTANDDDAEDDGADDHGSHANDSGIAD